MGGKVETYYGENYHCFSVLKSLGNSARRKLPVDEDTMDRSSWHCTGSSDQDLTQGKEMQKGTMVVWGGLGNSYEKKRSERQKRKGKIYPFECRVPKNSKER